MSKRKGNKASATTATATSSSSLSRPRKGVPTDGQFENMHHRYINEAAYHSAAIFAYAFNQYELVNRGCIYWLFDSYEAAVRPNNERPPTFSYRALALVEATEYKPVIDAVKQYDPQTMFVCLIAIRTGDRRDSLMKSVTLGRDAQAMVRTQSAFKTELSSGPFALWQGQSLELKEGHHFCASIMCEKYEEKQDEFKVCERCRFRVYCSRECQVNHWKLSHKYGCANEKLSHQARMDRLAKVLESPHAPPPPPAKVAADTATTAETKTNTASTASTAAATAADDTIDAEGDGDDAEETILEEVDE